MQLAIDFTTSSPINIDKLTKQNRLIYEHLSNGNTITVFDAVGMGILHLHSRIAEVRKVLNENNHPLYDRMIKVNDTDCKEYSLQPFNRA